MRLPEFKDKKIGIIGLGANNQKLAEFLKKQGIVFGVIDQWTSHDTLVGRLDDFDIVFRTPGLPYNSQAVQQAKSRGVVISSQTKLFFQLCPAPIIGVTGTKGKGTTSSLIAKIIETHGRKVWLAGNIGRDPFEFLEEIKPEDLVVLELSSFQLQDLEQSPEVAVVLNITPDHLNHHKDLEEYVKAKSSILAFQKSTNSAILHPMLPEWFRGLGDAQKIVFNPDVYSGWQTNLLGKHNLENIAAAVETAKILVIPEEEVRRAVAEFQALPHRLKILKTVNGITYIDDGYSTNVDPVIAAMEAMTKPFILIVGGYDKGLDFKEVGNKIKSQENLKGLVIIGAMTDKILKAVEGYTGKIMTGADNMDEIVKQAQSLATSGDAILFSPGTSSFDMFKNESDRADQFVRTVERIQ